jgi:hypothetical protein
LFVKTQLNCMSHLKDLEISKYKRELCCLIFVNCDLFSFLNIKKEKIENENTYGSRCVCLVFDRFLHNCCLE